MDLLNTANLKLTIGCDHAGFRLKETILTFLNSKQIVVEDFGAFSGERVDYPDYAVKVARAVCGGTHTAGILICATGIGMSITANKMPGIRAALCTTPQLAELSRRHNNANILCLGGRILSDEEACKIVDAWLNAPFDGGRHSIRLEKIEKLTRTN